MSDTGNQLEDELRNLLQRVLSAQLNGLTEKVTELSASISPLSRTLPRQYEELKEELAEADDALAEQYQALSEKLTGSVAEAREISEQQGEHLIRIFVESRAALSAQILEAQSNIADAREVLPAQLKAQAELSAQEVTKVILSAEDAAQQRDERRGEFLADAINRLAQSNDEKNKAQQAQMKELERKIGILKALSIATLAIVSLAAAGLTVHYILSQIAHL